MARSKALLRAREGGRWRRSRRSHDARISLREQEVLPAEIGQKNRMASLEAFCPVLEATGLLFLIRLGGGVVFNDPHHT